MNWGGVQAILVYRVAHALHESGVPLVPMALSYASRAVTGVEIHPAARIGADLFIDHGSGVVMGETAEIGDRVTLYQGVTLGGTGFARGKRHPTVEDDVTIGSGAKLLGPDHGRSLRQGRRQHGRDPGRARQLHRGRQSRAIRSGSRGAGSRAPTPTGSTCPTRSPTRSRAWRSGSASWSAAGRARRQAGRGRGPRAEPEARGRPSAGG